MSLCIVCTIFGHIVTLVLGFCLVSALQDYKRGSTQKTVISVESVVFLEVSLSVEDILNAIRDALEVDEVFESPVFSINVEQKIVTSSVSHSVALSSGVLETVFISLKATCGTISKHFTNSSKAESVSIG